MANEISNVEQQNSTPKEIAVYKGDEIRDKKLADATSATTAQSGDSVVVKTTAGTYVEIDRNSFSEIIREELGRLIKGTTDKGTSINGIAAMDASNDLGWVSAANLASVLGEQIVQLEHYDIDNLYSLSGNLNRFYKLLNCTNTPSGINYCLLHVFYQGGDCYQIAFAPIYSVTEYVFIRRRGNSQQWTGWSTISLDIPSFYKNYNSLAELKAALSTI